jgi:hypothetical protein
MGVASCAGAALGLSAIDLVQSISVENLAPKEKPVVPI